VHRSVRPYLALEYVDGLPLDLYAARHELSIRQRLALFEQVARAVAYAHARLIVHRDLKPTNVLVRASGEVLLLDFGIARLLQPDPHHQHFVHAFTPRYAAPEQLAGALPTVATDIYSLGVILYELLAGRSPYPMRDDIVCLEAQPILDVLEPRTARELGRNLAAIVAKALEAQPQDRYASIGEFLDDVNRYRRHQPVRARPDTLRYRVRMFARRYRAVVSLAFALFVAIAAGAMISLRQADIAVRERDRAVQMLEHATATNEFWNTVLTESVANRESVSMQELLARSERMAEAAASSSPLQYAVAVDSIAALYLSYGLPGKAESLLARTLERYQGIDAGEHVMCYLKCEYALAIGSLGRTQEAEAIFSEVMRGVRNEPNVLQYCLRSRAAVASENFDADRALEYIQQAQRFHLASPVQSPWDSAQILGELAFAHALKGDAELAQGHYERAWRVFETLGRSESHAALSMLNNWGILTTSMGDPAGALERYTRAVAIAEKRSPDGEPPPDLIGNRAAALAALGRYAEAVDGFDRMHKRAIADGNTRLIGFAVAGIADASLRRDDIERAREAMQAFTAEQRRTLLPNSPPLLRVSVVEARLLAQEHRLEQALLLLNSTLDAFAQRGTAIRPHALALIARTDVLLAMQRNDAALIDAQSAVAMAKAMRGTNVYSDLIGVALLAQGRAQLASGERTSAARSLREALQHLHNTVGDEHPDLRSARNLLGSG
jgi:tetratricopeptide (TPR) repeat protein